VSPPKVLYSFPAQYVFMDAKRVKGVGKGGGAVGKGGGVETMHGNAISGDGSSDDSGATEKDSGANGNAVSSDDERTIEVEALESGEEAIASWRARRRKEPDYDRIDRRATRHIRYRMTDVHLKMSQEGFSYMEAVRQKMNFGRGMSQGEFVEWAFSIVRRRYGKAIREHQKQWVMDRRERDESTNSGKEGTTSP